MGYTDAELRFLKSQPLGRIATVSASGEPDVAPVGFRLDGDDIVVGGFDITATRKHVNARATQRAAFVVDHLASVDPWRPKGLKIVGHARADEASIRITPRILWSWGINIDATRYHGLTEKRPFDEQAS